MFSFSAVYANFGFAKNVLDNNVLVFPFCNYEIVTWIITITHFLCKTSKLLRILFLNRKSFQLCCFFIIIIKSNAVQNQQRNGNSNRNMLHLKLSVQHFMRWLINSSSGYHIQLTIFMIFFKYSVVQFETF